MFWGALVGFGLSWTPVEDFGGTVCCYISRSTYFIVSSYVHFMSCFSALNPVDIQYLKFL